MSDFDAFPPTPQSMEIAGVELAISPIRVGEIPVAPVRFSSYVSLLPRLILLAPALTFVTVPKTPATPFDIKYISPFVKSPMRAAGILI